MDIWNPWHGCHKISPGCANCYVYRRDKSVGRDASKISRTAQFSLPLKKGRDGLLKLRPGSDVFCCGTSDFFLDEADPWRAEAWEIIRARPDLRFLIITKRIDRFNVALPEAYPKGYEHVRFGNTCENQDRANARMPTFLALPIPYKIVICEPLLGPLDLSGFLGSGVQQVVVGGESGEGARECRYDWVLSIRNQCKNAGVAFHFKQTGAIFIKDGRTFHIPRSEQMRQARKADIDLQSDP